MDCIKIGSLIAKLRKEKGLTQKNIADILGIQSKTVSKWECGWGCPDAEYWSELSEILGVDISQMMNGQIISNKPDTGKLEKSKYYACPECGNILVSTSQASIFCCGRKLENLSASDYEKPEVNAVQSDTDYFITVNHSMEKEHYISFVSYINNDKVYLIRLYPEQNCEFRIPMSMGAKGKLYLYCNRHGLAVYENLF